MIQLQPISTSRTQAHTNINIWYSSHTKRDNSFYISRPVHSTVMDTNKQEKQMAELNIFLQCQKYIGVSKSNQKYSLWGKPIVVQAYATRRYLMRPQASVSWLALSNDVMLPLGLSLFCSASPLFINFCNDENEATECFHEILFSTEENRGWSNYHASDSWYGCCYK